MTLLAQRRSAKLWSSTSVTTNGWTVAGFHTNPESQSWRRKSGKVSLVNWFFVGQLLPSCLRRGIRIHKRGLETMTHALKCDHNCWSHSRLLPWHFFRTRTQKVQRPLKVILYLSCSNHSVQVQRISIHSLIECNCAVWFAHVQFIQLSTNK